MIRKGLIVIGVLMLACSPVRSQDVVLPNFDLVLDMAGYVIQRRVDSLEEISVTKPSPVGGPTDVKVDAVYAEARSPSGPYVRLMAFTTVSEKEGLRRNAHVTFLVDASLETTRDQNGIITLRIAAVGGTFSATADFPRNDWARDLVLCLAPELVSKFVVDVPLEGLEVIDAVRPPGRPPIRAIAYELGYGWVLQVVGAMRESCVPAPRIFLIGNAFTMFLRTDIVRRLADQQLSSGVIPRRLNDQGMPQTDGTIHVDRVVASLARDVISLEWQGHVSDGSPAVARWDMSFVDTPDGLLLEIKRLTVNGKEVPVPTSAEIINPIDALIKSMLFGPKGGKLFASPLGTVRITVGQIRPEGILIAGRA